MAILDFGKNRKIQEDKEKCKILERIEMKMKNKSVQISQSIDVGNECKTRVILTNECEIATLHIVKFEI